jgi:hypothetical protein
MKTIAMDDLDLVSGGVGSQGPMTIFNPSGPRPTPPFPPERPVPNPLPGLPGLPGGKDSPGILGLSSLNGIS